MSNLKIAKFYILFSYIIS